MSGSASSTAITLGPGITLTPAAGWQIDRPGDNVAELHSPDGNAVLDVTVGTGDAKDAAAELNNDVQQLPQNSDLSNVKTAKCSTSTLGNRQFQQLSGCGFTADLASDQGTFQVQGMLAEYMNPTSGMGAFIVFFAQHQAAYEAARQDVVAMLASMLV
jgi:hypothetical protein